MVKEIRLFQATGRNHENLRFSNYFRLETDIWGAFSGGLLADSPAAFRESGNIVSSANRQNGSFSSTNKGLRLELPLISQSLSRPHTFIPLLACNRGGDAMTRLGFDCKQVPGRSNHFLLIKADKLFAVEPHVMRNNVSKIEHRAIYVQPLYIPRRASQSLNTYLEIVPELQQRGILLAKSIPAIEIMYRDTNTRL
jgi:hypothetical protein